MSVGKENHITLIGAGPVGSLLAIFLARSGFDVTIFERRPDMRRHDIGGGRSINLAVSTRGLYALESVGLKNQVMDMAIPMLGRMMHSRDGALSFQQYGRNENEFINSVSRGELNKLLMTAAEKTGKVKIHFNSRVTGVDFETKTLAIDGADISQKSYDVLIGTDGSASVVRAELIKRARALNLKSQMSEDHLDYGYKEFHIPPRSDSRGTHGIFSMDKNALHIWPRGNYMLIALPNGDGSFTATLFLPHKGDLSFDALKTSDDIKSLFTRDFKDVLEKMPNLVSDFLEHPLGHMTTVKCRPWTLGDALLLGDAAHAIVPFFGQGMNCGFEDCSILDELLKSKKSSSSLREVFLQFEEARKINCDAIADMAVENFVEMRDKVGNKKFLLQKQIEQELQKKFPQEYVSRYAMVTFSRVPYHEALRDGAIQNEILDELSRGVETLENVNWKAAEALVETKLKRS